MFASTRHQEYRPTGIPWCPNIPSHWQLVRNKTLLKRVVELVGVKSTEYRLLSLTKRGVIFRDLSTGKGKIPASFESLSAH